MAPRFVSASVWVWVLSLVVPLAAARAQAGGGSPRTVAGVCGATNWVCVAECIDAECLERCLREGCEQALLGLKACTVKARCAPDDTQCAARACGNTCQKAFEPAPRSPEKERQNPCEGVKAPTGRVPKDLVGTWTLAAASLPEKQDDAPERIESQPRADYVRSLEVTPDGCFVLRTALQDATLGLGNSLVVRAWGSVEMSGSKSVVLKPSDGQAVGPLCGDKRVIPLRKGKFLGGSFQWEFEEGELSLMRADATKQTFLFQRSEADKVPEGALDHEKK